ncbi:ABC transporter ATP-binding protein [Lentibacillus saliphilus]|uniref:ABC transporter ATP-binding protein n=1 Tax=Lentibacillus saliphilus TaxID=2737028 RepID=UPI003CCEF7BB
MLAMPSKAKTPILEVTHLKQYFPVKKERILEAKRYVQAVDDVSFSVEPGTTVSIVGESGCGKSTTGRAILRLDDPTSGTIEYNGQDIAKLSKKELKAFRGDIQVIFQDPFASLNPRRTIRQMLNEAMSIQNVMDKTKREDRMLELMDLVGLPYDSLERLPHEFSGGQRQRLGIARALAVNPKLIVCDEAVSALDVSVQAQVLNLMKKLQKELNLTYLFISHDLSVVKHISNRIIVMYLGKIVEIADNEDLFQSPRHPYTQALLSAIPIPDVNVKRTQIDITGDVPSPINPPKGCRFHTRCPFATEHCRTVEPELRTINNTHQVSCHYAETLSF